MSRIRSIKIETLPSINAASPYVCTTYVIREQTDSYLKIGIATHPTRRLCSLQSGNPRKLRFVAVYEGTRTVCHEIEKLAHKYFGVEPKTEWFIGNPNDAIKYLNSFTDDEVAQ